MQSSACISKDHSCLEEGCVCLGGALGGSILAGAPVQVWHQQGQGLLVQQLTLLVDPADSDLI